MRKLIKYVIAAALCIYLAIGIRLVGAIGKIDTTGQPPIVVTIIAVVVGLSLFVWLALKINKNG